MEARRQGIRDVGYGIRDTWIDPAKAVPAIAPKTVEEVNTRVVELVELHEHDTQDLYALLEDAQDGRIDSMDVEEEAYAARGAWNHLWTESGDLIRSFRPNHDHVYAYEDSLQTIRLSSSFSVLSFRLSTSPVDRGPSPCQDMRREYRADMQTGVAIQRESAERETTRTGCYNPRSPGGYWGLEESHLAVRTRRGQTPPLANPNNTNNMTPEAVQTMIDQALLRNSGGGDGSHSSHANNPRNMHTARPCYYADFMKCHL
ncbi:hypothetical protein Tco_0090402 [Tanacetum coccineum]